MLKYLIEIRSHLLQCFIDLLGHGGCLEHCNWCFLGLGFLL